jgi:hypothetical protein
MEVKQSQQQIPTRIGKMRQEFIYYANVTWVNSQYNPGELLKARGWVQAWENLLNPGSEEKKEFMVKLEIIENEKKEDYRNWKNETDSMTVLQKFDNQSHEIIIEGDAISKMIAVAGDIQKKYGLQND